jgi:glutamine synthetase
MTTTDIHQFFRERGISEVEAIIPDMAGVARGKIMPAEKFAADKGMRLPESIFLQTVTGDYPSDTSAAMSPAEIDIVLKADARTVRVVPWAAEPTAQVIHDCFYSDGRRVSMAPRHVLRHVLELYAQRGWEPVIAPELEFYLIEPNIDADYPLKPPVGRSGRAEPGRQSYSIAAVNEFDPLFDDIYAFCEAQDIEIDTLIHEDGPAQMEINLLHGDPLDLADQATRCTRRSWPSRTARSPAAPCTSTRASSTARRARTSSAIPTARPRRCSSRTSVACRNTCRRRWRCSRRT